MWIWAIADVATPVSTIASVAVTPIKPPRMDLFSIEHPRLVETAQLHGAIEVYPRGRKSARIHLIEFRKVGSLSYHFLNYAARRSRSKRTPQLRLRVFQRDKLRPALHLKKIGPGTIYGFFTVSSTELLSLP
jgi:hypothetical protein